MLYVIYYEEILWAKFFFNSSLDLNPPWIATNYTNTKYCKYSLILNTKYYIYLTVWVKFPSWDVTVDRVSQVPLVPPRPPQAGGNQVSATI